MSAWDEARVGGRAGQRFALGLWHPLYKVASLAWVPPASERRKLFGRTWYTYVFNVQLDPNGVANDRFTVTSDFLWTTAAASTAANDFGGDEFSIQVFDAKSGVRYMDFPLLHGEGDEGNVFAGTYPMIDPLVSPALLNIHASTSFNFPYIHRMIPKIPKGTTLMAKVQNFSQVNALSVQIAMGGYH
jgi:hypothetical protein